MNAQQIANKAIKILELEASEAGMSVHEWVFAPATSSFAGDFDYEGVEELLADMDLDEKPSKIDKALELIEQKLSR